MKRICVFCGSSSGSRPEYRAAAEELGAELVRRKIGLVYGGGNVGLMGVLADAVLNASGEAIGVIPEHLMAREIGHNGLTKLHVVRSMHERKALMADLSDAFVAMPGGYGTLEEFCEIVTWAQLGLHAKPCGILNVQGYYSPLLAMFDHAVQERFLKPENRELVLARNSAAELLRALEDWRASREVAGSGDAVREREFQWSRRGCATGEPINLNVLPPSAEAISLPSPASATRVSSLGHGASSVAKPCSVQEPSLSECPPRLSPHRRAHNRCRCSNKTIPPRSFR